MKRVLWVDDNEDLIDASVGVFARFGFEVVKAVTATQALTLLSTEHLDGMLLDVRLRGEDGLALLEDLRTRRSTLPVVVLTGYPDHEGSNRAYLAGAAYWSKSRHRLPANPEKLEGFFRGLHDAFSHPRQAIPTPAATGSDHEQRLVANDMMESVSETRDLAKVSVRKLIGQMYVGQLWALIIGLATAFAFVFGIGYKSAPSRSVASGPKAAEPIQKRVVSAEASIYDTFSTSAPNTVALPKRSRIVFVNAECRFWTANTKEVFRQIVTHIPIRWEYEGPWSEFVNNYEEYARNDIGSSHVDLPADVDPGAPEKWRQTLEEHEYDPDVVDKMTEALRALSDYADELRALELEDSGSFLVDLRKRDNDEGPFHFWQRAILKEFLSSTQDHNMRALSVGWDAEGVKALQDNPTGLGFPLQEGASPGALVAVLGTVSDGKWRTQSVRPFAALGHVIENGSDREQIVRLVMNDDRPKDNLERAQCTVYFRIEKLLVYPAARL